MLHGKSILVVDDEPDLREILCEEFALCGAKAIAVSSGQEALSVVQKQPVDLVVSDMRMPGGDGVSLAKTLKARRDSPLVVLMTGLTDLSVEDAFEIGIEGFWTKPFHIEMARENLARLLETGVERWSRPREATACPLLTADPGVYAGQSCETYLGRGGFFLAGSSWQTAPGQEIRFHAGAGLEGVGLVRWVRRPGVETRGPGAAVEFLSLTSASRAWVAARLAQSKPVVYLPKGF